MPSENDVLIVRDDVVTRESDGELVVVLPERGKFFVLNPTGLRVMQLVDGTRTLGDVARVLAEEYEADIARVARDVVQLAAALLERGALVAVDV